MYESYKDEVQFFLIYTREAHPDHPVLVEKDGHRWMKTLDSGTTFDDRCENADVCTSSLHLKVPVLVDRASNDVSTAYQAWPLRVVIVGADGNLAYCGNMHPQQFQLDDVRNWLQKRAKANPITHL